MQMVIEKDNLCTFEPQYEFAKSVKIIQSAHFSPVPGNENPHTT